MKRETVRLIAITLAQFLFHLFEFTTDLLLSVEWFNGFKPNLEKTKLCVLDGNKQLQVGAVALLICSSIGFLSGIIQEKRKAVADQIRPTAEKNLERCGAVAASDTSSIVTSTGTVAMQ